MRYLTTTRGDTQSLADAGMASWSSHGARGASADDGSRGGDVFAAVQLAPATVTVRQSTRSVLLEAGHGQEDRPRCRQGDCKVG
jgi:hypothetical protein